MAHYIDKDDLVSEIERRMKNLTHEMSKFYYASNYNEWKFAVNEYKSLMSFINTLEVKEVDLEKEIEKYCRKYYNCNYPDQIQSGKCSGVMPHIVEAARRFFELGLTYSHD